MKQDRTVWTFTFKKKWNFSNFVYVIINVINTKYCNSNMYNVYELWYDDTNMIRLMRNSVIVLLLLTKPYDFIFQVLKFMFKYLVWPKFFGKHFSRYEIRRLLGWKVGLRLLEFQFVHFGIYHLFTLN